MKIKKGFVLRKVVGENTHADANRKDQTQAEDSFGDIFMNTHIHLGSCFLLFY